MIDPDRLVIDSAAFTERVLRDRFGEFATIRYQRASNHNFRRFPFGSWLADKDLASAGGSRAETPTSSGPIRQRVAGPGTHL